MVYRILLPFLFSLLVMFPESGRCGDHQSCNFPTQFDVVASGLRNPQGFTIASDGTIYIAQSGLTVSPPVVPFAITDTGRISHLCCNGKLKVLTDNLIGVQGSVEGTEQENTGFISVAWLKGKLYALSSFGPLSGISPFPTTGVYRVDLQTGALTLIADINAFDVAHCNPANPNCHTPPVFSSPFDMIAWRGKLYVSNGHTDAIDQVDPDLPLNSNIVRFADFSGLVPGEPHPVITGINVDPQGEFLFAVQLTPFASNPQPPNSARVWRISKSGTIKQVAQGYNFGQGVAVDAKGRIYVTQFAQEISTLGVYSGEGSLVRWNPKKELFETVLPNLTLPGAIRIKGDNLYLSNYTQLGQFGEGQLVRIRIND